MSYYLDQIEDDDDYSEENYSGEDEAYQDDEYSEEVEESVEEEEKPKIDILAMASEKKKGGAKKQPVLDNKANKQKKDTKSEVMTMTEEELQHYQDLKLYGSTTKKPKQKSISTSEQVHFKLDVLQSSKMFFETIRPSEIIVISGNSKFDEQKRYVLRHSWNLRNEKKYRNDDEVVACEVVAKPYTVQETSSKSNKFAQSFNQHFDRSDHMCCLSSDDKNIFIYGGRSGKITPDELIRYDLQNGKAYIFKGLHLVSHCGHSAECALTIPPISNSEMIICGTTLYIFGATTSSSPACTKSQQYSAFGYYGTRNYTSYNQGEMNIYAVSNIYNPEKINYGLLVASTNATDYSQYVHPYKSLTSAFVDKRSHFSLSKYVKGGNLVECYMFGGKKNSAPNDEMFKYTFDGTITFAVEEIKKPSRQDMAKNPNLVWPSPRFSHSECVISNLIFIFGGIGAKGEFFNDMFMFDTSTDKWTEIICDSILPPGVFKHQSFSVNNQSLYIYGGRTETDDTSSLYRFDIIDKKWNYIEMVSEEVDAEVSKYLPCSGHQCLVHQGKVIRVGGLSTKGDPFVRLINISDPGKPVPLCEFLSNKKAEGFLCDVVFRLRDKSSGEVDTITHLLAHRAIVKSRCSYLHQKILQSTEKMSTLQLSGTFTDDGEISLVDITECSTEVFNAYLNYLYTGEIKLECSEDVSSFLEFTKLTSPEVHYPLVSVICLSTEKKNLENTKKILDQLHQDLSSLVNDHSYSDLILMLDSQGIQQNEDHFEPPEIPETSFGTGVEESSVECCEELISPLTSHHINMGGIAVHRLIMSRSPFFSRMFVTSGMIESKEKVVHLHDYSSEVMLEMLKYLYTDTIRLSSKNCLGILVYCIMLDLVDMASCCRRMVVSLLDNSNIWTVMEIAMLYNDKTLESDCEHFILSRFDELSTSTGFFNLPELTRIKIKQINEKRKSKK